MQDYKNLQEEELIQLVQSGIQDAYAPLVSKYKNLVFALLLKSVPDFHLAEELAQDTFISAFKGIKNFRFESQFSTWLGKIAINTAFSYRSSKIATQRKSTFSQDFESKSIADSPEEELINKQKYKTFQACFQKLSKRLKQAMLLVALQNYSYEESSELLEIPIGTIRSRLNQARLLVLECMSKTTEGEKL